MKKLDLSEKNLNIQERRELVDTLDLCGLEPQQIYQKVKAQYLNSKKINMSCVDLRLKCD